MKYAVNPLRGMLHVLLDAARMGTEMNNAQKLNDNFRCLYKGESEKALANVAPYLFNLSDQKSFSAWLFEQGWGKSWGVYVESAASPADVYRHFRKFLLVRTEAGKELYFRFYDPRVLKQFLPIFTPPQLVDFFGPTQYFLLEDEDATFWSYYWLESGVLRSKQINRQEAEQKIQC